MDTTHNDSKPAADTAIHYFPSGSNHPGEILGFADAGMNVGATIVTLRLNAAAVLASLAGLLVKVFLDSGAFSEVTFPAGVPTITSPITDEDWTARLDATEELAEALGSQLYAVAPDCVAHQAETLERLARYADRVRTIRAHGANILVAHQKGELSLVDFNRRAAEILGFSDFVVAVPMMKDETSLDELAELLGTVRPVAVHFLGIGPKSPRFAAVVEAARNASPSTVIYCDSVAITSLVGRNNGPNGGPRALTAASDAALETVRVESWGEGVEGELDYSDSVLENVNEWLVTRAGRKSFLDAVAAFRTVTNADRRAFYADPYAWLTDEDEDGDSPIDCDWVAAELDALYAAAAEKRTVTFRKRTAVASVFTGSELAAVNAAALAAHAPQDASDAAAGTEDLSELRAAYKAAQDAALEAGLARRAFNARAAAELEAAGVDSPSPADWLRAADLVLAAALSSSSSSRSA